MSAFDKRAADRMAYEIARLVKAGRIDERSRASDAALDYMQVGGIDGPKSAPEWVDAYELRNGIPEHAKLYGGPKADDA